MDALEMGLKASANAAKEVVKAFDNGLLGVKRFNFKSQICTTREQSERLLALGLKKETADMVYRSYGYIIDEFGDKERIFKQPTMVVDGWESKHDIPAWSLHRLIEICGKDRLPISFHKKGKVKIRVNHIYPTHDGRSGYNYYDSIIDCIEWLIKEGYFNKEYLEE